MAAKGQGGQAMLRRLGSDPGVEVLLRKSAQARRFSLRVSRLDGRVTLSMPLHAREADALAFAEAQAGWIRRAQGNSAPMQAVVPGLPLPVEGRLLTLTEAAVRAPRIEGEALLVPRGRAAPAARAWLRHLAGERLRAASDLYAARLGLPYAGLTLRDTRSRWGSCSAEGQLMYSWRLIMAPPEVLAYVAAHEVAHLAEMNHSDRFWAGVARLMPDYARHRLWLKRQGNALHRYDFAGAGGMSAD